MPSGEEITGRGMIKVRRRPAIGGVADLALLVEIRKHMLWIRAVHKIGIVTGIASALGTGISRPVTGDTGHS